MNSNLESLNRELDVYIGYLKESLSDDVTALSYYRRGHIEGQIAALIFIKKMIGFPAPIKNGESAASLLMNR